MNEFSDTEIWIATTFAFAIGYVLVSFLARLMKTEPPAAQPTFSESQSGIAGGEDLKYAQVLGISLPVTPSELERAYQDSLAKYHPEPVAHLDEAFRQLAQQRTREIEEAYAFLKNRQASE